MSKMISDDRLDMKKLMAKIYAMTDEEFAEYLKSGKDKDVRYEHLPRA